MAIYCVGDIQGCDGAFERLIAHIGFSPSRDTLYLLGDLVNRGPDSAAVLRRCMQWGDSARALLGNHDLHLLAMAHGVTPTGIATAWITRHPANIQVVLGTTSAARVAEAAAGSDVVLSRPEWYRLLTAAGHTLP